MRPKGILLGIYYGGKLSLQSLGMIVRAKLRYRRARAIFQRTLLLHGISREVAQELARAYPNPVSEVISSLATRRNKAS